MKRFLSLWILHGLIAWVALADDFPVKHGYQWSPTLEWEIANPTVEGNPFDVAATATFQHPGGEKRQTGLFYAGNQTWKFRFTATQVGEWTVSTQSSDPELHGKTGRVIIKANPDQNAHGFVTSIGNRWAWSGTNRVFVPQLVMYDHPADLYNQAEKIDRDIQLFFDDHGFNGFHIGVLTRWFDLHQSNYDNLSDDPNPDFRTFETLEMLITKAHAAGGMVHIWAWGDESRHMTPDKWGKNKRVDQRLQRYIAARLGPIPGWTMGYGFDCDEWVEKEDLQQWHAYMHKHFGWPHLLGARDPNPNYSSDPLTQIYEGLDYSGYEHHRPTYKDYVRAIEGRPDKPSFSEDRFRIRVPARYPKKDYNEELTRRGLWDSTMAGGVANIWGNLDGATSDASVAYPHQEWIKTYAVFFKDRFLNGMVRDNDLTDGVCLKLPQHTQFVFYKENTDSITFDLSDIPAKLPCIAVDACKPYEEIKIGLRAAEKMTWKAPYVSDWAVAVGAFGFK